MLVKLCLFFLLLIQSTLFAAEVKFSCSDKNLKVSGSLDETGGGKLEMSGGEANLIFGNSDTKFSKSFYRHLRKNETAESHQFAKFDVKSEENRGKWLAKYYRFSLPKSAFKGQKSFVAYFAYYHDDKSNSPAQSAMYNPEQEKVDEAELKEIQNSLAKESATEQHDEYKMSCALI
jgi:hypothetical protein